MRALKVDEAYIANESILYDGDKLHHFVNVLRLQSGEQVILFSSNGNYRKYSIEEISKKHIKFKSTQDIQNQKKKHHIDCMIGVTKRDAFEDCLRLLVELAVGKLIPVKMKNSHFDFELTDRQIKIIEAAHEQSNNFHNLEIERQSSQIHSEVLRQYRHVFVFTSELDPVKCDFHIDITQDRVLCILGPEGGFSIEELNCLRDISNVSFIRLSTAILKTPTALPTAIGYILGSSH